MAVKNKKEPKESTKSVDPVSEQNTRLQHLKKEYVKEEKLDTKKEKNGLVAKFQSLMDVTTSDEVNDPRLTSLKKDEKKKVPKMDLKLFIEIIKNDPTSVFTKPVDQVKNLEDIKHVGKYTSWMCKVWRNIVPEDFKFGNNLKSDEIRDKLRMYEEDLYKMKEDLIKFDRFKGQISEDHEGKGDPNNKRDINHIKDGDELYEITKSFREKAGDVTKTKQEQKLEIKNKDVDLLFEDNLWQVLVPKTVKAAVEVSGPPLTRWCTASSDSSSQFEYYSKNGPLYIIRDKSNIVKTGRGSGDPRPVYQLHFANGTFMDADDKTFPLDTFLKKPGNEQLKKFFQPIYKGAFEKREFNLEDKIFEGYISVYGSNEETHKLILNHLKNKISTVDDMIVNDDDRAFGGYVKTLGHDEFLARLFEYANREVKVMEISFTKYTGDGIDVPESLGEFKSLVNLVLSGFVRTIPKSIGNLKLLELCAVPKNTKLKEIPVEMSHLIPPVAGETRPHGKLQVLNITGSNIQKKIPVEVSKYDENGDFMIVSN